MNVFYWTRASALPLAVVFVSMGVQAQQPPKVTIQNAETIVSPEMVSRATWDSNAFYQIYKQRSYENLVLLFMATAAYRSDPNLDPKVELGYLNKLHGEYRNKYLEADGQYHLPEDAVQAAQSMLSLAGAYGGAYAKAAEPLADEILKWGVKGYESYEKGPKQIEAQKYLSDTASYTELLGRYVDDAWVLSHENKSANEAITTYFGRVFNADPGDSAAAIKQKNSDFKLSNDVDKLLSSSQNNTISLDQLRDAVMMHNKQLAMELGKVRKALSDLDKAQTAYFTAASEEERKRIAGEAEKARYDINIEGAKSSVYLLSTFAAFLHNPNLAHTITVTGNATIQVVDAVQKYNSAISISQTSLNRAASSVTLAANWVGAGLAIASLMQPGGSSDQIIMDQLNAIRQQLVLLRQEMHDRFDRIDLKLNQLFDAMGNQFEVLVTLLNNQQVSLGEISFDRELDKQLKLCFTPIQRMNQTEFRKCLFNLKYQALDVSLDPLRSASLDDQTIVNTSAVRPLAASYVYMARMGGERFKDGEMQSLESQLPNPVEWSFAVDAYLGLAQEWPQFGKTIDSGDLRQMREAGETLKKMARASRQTSFYDIILDNYQAKVNSLRSRLMAAEDDFAIQHVPGGNPFRRGSKVFKYSTPTAIKRGSLSPCPWRSENYVTSTQTLDIPVGIEKFLPSEYWMADNLGIAQLQLCYEVPQYFEERSSKVSATLPKGITIYKFLQPPAVRIQAYFIDPEVDKHILIAFDRQVTSSTSILWGYKEQSDTQPGRYRTDEGRDPSGNAVRIWQSELRDKFVTNSTDQFPDGWGNWAKDANSKRVNELLDKKFDALTATFYQGLLQSFKGTDSVGVAARELTAAKVLLESFLSIGYGEALDHDESFRSLIFGSESIPSGQDVENSFSVVFQSPRAKMRSESLAALKEMKIDPSKQALVDSVKARNAKAVFRLLALGYWDEMNQTERASLMQDASTAAAKSLEGMMVYGLLQDNNQNGFDYRYRNQEAALSLKPYKFLGEVLDSRLKSLRQKIQENGGNKPEVRFPMIDGTLERLNLFIQFHANTQNSSH
jgi:hypothetical protein